MKDRPTRLRALTGFFAGMTAITYVLVVFGAAVRANGAGLACPDWPLCFGELVPSFDFGVILEWGHRALAGGVSIGLVAGLALAWRRPDTRKATWGLGWLALVLLAAQVVMGGLTVLKLLASWTVTGHLLLGNGFAAVLLCLALALRDGGRTASARPALAASTSGLLKLATVLLVVQLTLGGLVSSGYAGLACPDWPTCYDGQWFPTLAGAQGLQIAHRLVAYGLVAAWLGLLVLLREDPGLRTFARLGAVVVLLQAALGVVNVLWALPVEVTILHTAGAAALVLLTTATVRAARQRDPVLQPLPASRIVEPSR